jgi:predicted nucleotidyltransferase
MHGTLSMSTDKYAVVKHIAMPLTNPRHTLTRVLAETAPHGLISAYLFGSYAEARAHTESDIDVGVLLHRDLYPSPRERFAERVRFTAWLVGVLGVNAVDVVILSDAPPELGRRIVTKGQRVYCADRQADHAFVRDVQLRAADLDLFLRRTRRVTLQALARP